MNIYFHQKIQVYKKVQIVLLTESICSKLSVALKIGVGERPLCYVGPPFLIKPSKPDNLKIVPLR